MKRRPPKTSFPHDYLKVGDAVTVRYIRHRGHRNDDAVVGPWRMMRVSYVQRDGLGQICGIAFDGLDAEFDPRHDWMYEPYPVLMIEEHELQFQFDHRERTLT